MSRGTGKDEVFSKRLSDVKPFEFDENVANVFRDMISRSVPGYALLLRMIGLYADVFVQPGSRVFDLGCSLGDASLVIADRTDAVDCEIVAVDNSPAMFEKCKQHESTQKKYRVALRGHSANRDFQCFDGGVKSDAAVSAPRRKADITGADFSRPRFQGHISTLGKGGV